MSSSPNEASAPAAAPAAEVPVEQPAAAMRSAAVIGGTGCVGKAVVKALLADERVQRVVLISRRSSPDAAGDARVEEVLLPQFTVEDMAAPAVSAALTGVDALFVTLGVGKASKATKEELYNVDVALPAALAATAQAAGVRHCALLSAVNADASANSWFNQTFAGGALYAKYKGLVEHRVRALPFPSATAYRPAGIMENPNTGAFNWIGPKIEGLLPAKYKNVTATQLGLAMVNGARLALEGRAPAGDAQGKEESGAPLPPKAGFSIYGVPVIRALIANP